MRKTVAPPIDRREPTFSHVDHPIYTHKDESLDGEVATDIKGRKHVEQNDNADGVYFLDCHANSAHSVFPPPGKASAETLRWFLQAYLPVHLITDEYGRVVPMAHISDDHLPSLQAQMWRYAYQDDTSPVVRLENLRDETSVFASRSPPVSRKVSGATKSLLLAPHISAIADLLDGTLMFKPDRETGLTMTAKHVFIIRDKATGTCELPTCRTRMLDQPLSSPFIAIEPIIHFGTISPATELYGKILTFRRNGDMCNNPLWTLAIKRFSSEHPPTYCLECLEYLMGNRLKAWTAVERIKGPEFTTLNDRRTYTTATRGRQIEETAADAECKHSSKHVAGISRAAVGNDKCMLLGGIACDENMLVSHYKCLMRSRTRVSSHVHLSMTDAEYDTDNF